MFWLIAFLFHADAALIKFVTTAFCQPCFWN